VNDSPFPPPKSAKRKCPLPSKKEQSFFPLSGVVKENLANSFFFSSVVILFFFGRGSVKCLDASRGLPLPLESPVGRGEFTPFG